jgi:solute carrier family 25 protein 33/36
MGLSRFAKCLLLAASAVSDVSSVHFPRIAVGLDRKSSFPSSSHDTRRTTKTRGGASAAVAVKTMTAMQHKAFNILSGGVAGTVAATITNPLEVVKAQLQSSNMVAGEMAKARGHPISIAQRIFKQDGVSGFFRGLPPTLIGIIPSRSAYFYAYQQSKKALNPYFKEGSPANALLSGLAAGITGNTLTNPIWMVRTRMQLLADASAGQRAYTGYGDVIKSIYRNEGIAGFYKGIQASYWGCTEGAIQFIIYEQMKTRLLTRQNRIRAKKGLDATTTLPEWEYFGSAALAKAIAAIATYPHEVARTRLREQARGGVFKYQGMWGTLATIAKEEGRSGLYAGMGVHLMKVVPNSAIMFLTYELVNVWLRQFEIVEPPTSRVVDVTDS